MPSNPLLRNLLKSDLSIFSFCCSESSLTFSSEESWLLAFSKNYVNALTFSSFLSPSLRSLFSSFKLGYDSIELFSSGLSFESSKLLVNARSILHHKKNPLDQMKRGLAKVKVLIYIIIYFNLVCGCSIMKF